ncbi:PAS domain-containing protein, partial [bacterium]|nr:PAS domain-containing protein [bacterium]
MDAWNQSFSDNLGYAYRLNGGEWSHFSEEKNHLFLSLNSGNYFLEVRARDGDFNIDPTPAVVRFTVMPPVWRQAWFIGMVVLFVGAIGFFEWRVIQRERRLHVSNISLQERTEELQTSNNQLEMANKKIIKTSKALRRSNKELEQSKKILEYANKEALDREQYLMYALMNNVHDKIYFKDKEGRFIRVNKATSMAHGIMDPQEMVGTSDFDFFEKEYAQEAIEYEQEVMRIDQPIEKEEKEKWSDGHEIWVSTMKQPLRDLKGNIVGTFGITRDITERKLSEIAIQKANEDVRQKAEALARSNQELQQFAYVAYHDLQEPLRMVASYVQLLADRYKGKLNDEANEFIGYAVDGTKRIKQLINDLLVYSSITTNSKPFQPVDCEVVFERIEMNLNGMLEEYKAVMKHDRLPTVQADVKQLERLFFNLIDNAIKYHSEKHLRYICLLKRMESHGYFQYAIMGLALHLNFMRRSSVFLNVFTI